MAQHATVAAAGGGLSIAVADAPAASPDPRTAFYIVESARPGTTVERSLRISNDDVAPVHASLYVGGAAVRSGALAFDDRAAPPAAIARWSSVTPDQLTLAPGSASEAHLRIAVPRHARAGEELGVVWAETRTSGAAGSTVNRVGVRIYLAVDAHPPRSDLQIDTAVAARDASGTPHVDITVRNTGDREIEPSGEVVLAGRTGASTPFAPGLALLPGQHGTLRATIASAVDAEPTSVEVHVRANGVARRASVALAFPSAPGTRGDPVALDHDARGSSRTGPAALAVLLAVVAAMALARERTRRASRR